MTPDWPPGPARPSLEPGEAHVWLAHLDAPGWPPADALPAAERERAERRRGERERARWTAARWTLRLVLARYLVGDPAGVALATRPDDKPELGPAPDVAAPPLRFNLSHSGGLALVALAREREVGVDVERLSDRRDPLALADRWLDPDAADAVRAAPAGERRAVFHRAWTRHEATRKCTGAGLSGPAPDPAALWVADLAPGEGYAGALALEGPPAAAVRTWTLAPPTL